MRTTKQTQMYQHIHMHMHTKISRSYFEERKQVLCYIQDPPVKSPKKRKNVNKYFPAIFAYILVNLVWRILNTTNLAAPRSKKWFFLQNVSLFEILHRNKIQKSPIYLLGLVWKYSHKHFFSKRQNGKRQHSSTFGLVHFNCNRWRWLLKSIGVFFSRRAASRVNNICLTAETHSQTLFCMVLYGIVWFVSIGIVQNQYTQKSRHEFGIIG